MSKFIKTAKKLAAGAALAGAAGYLAGLLTAPKSGRETREELRSATGGKFSEIEKQLKGLHGELDSLAGEAKDKGDDLSGKAQKELHKLAESAKDSKEKVREVLTSVQSGKASDKDLNKALADAKHAIDHIKDYLKK